MNQKILKVIRSCSNVAQLESARQYLLLATRKGIPGVSSLWREYIEHRRRVVFGRVI